MSKKKPLSPRQCRAENRRLLAANLDLSQQVAKLKAENNRHVQDIAFRDQQYKHLIEAKEAVERRLTVESRRAADAAADLKTSQENASILAERAGDLDRQLTALQTNLDVVRAQRDEARECLAKAEASLNKAMPQMTAYRETLEAVRYGLDGLAHKVAPVDADAHLSTVEMERRVGLVRDRIEDLELRLHSVQVEANQVPALETTVKVLSSLMLRAPVKEFRMAIDWGKLGGDQKVVGPRG